MIERPFDDGLHRAIEFAFDLTRAPFQLRPPLGRARHQAFALGVIGLDIGCERFRLGELLRKAGAEDRPQPCEDALGGVDDDAAPASAARAKRRK